jgi:aconitate hydratase
MGPEYGATCGFFPVDGNAQLPHHVRPRGRAASPWSKPIPRRRACGATPAPTDPVFTDTLELDLGDVVPSMAGPKRPEGRIALETVGDIRLRQAWKTNTRSPAELDNRYAVEGEDYDLGHGDVAIAAITSCTNTSNPSVLIGAGLVAKKANELGLKPSRG